jgi:hypothetical protein
LLARAAGGQRLALAVPLISVLIALLTGVGLGARLVELRG